MPTLPPSPSPTPPPAVQVPCPYSQAAPSTLYYPNNVNTSNPYAQIQYASMCGLLPSVPSNWPSIVVLGDGLLLNLFGSFQNDTQMQFNIPVFAGTASILLDYTAGPSFTLTINGTRHSVAGRRLLETTGAKDFLLAATGAHRHMLQATQCATLSQCISHCNSADKAAAALLATGGTAICATIAVAGAPLLVGPFSAAICEVGVAVLTVFTQLASNCDAACQNMQCSQPCASMPCANGLIGHCGDAACDFCQCG